MAKKKKKLFAKEFYSELENIFKRRLPVQVRKHIIYKDFEDFGIHFYTRFCVIYEECNASFAY